MKLSYRNKSKLTLKKKKKISHSCQRNTFSGSINHTRDYITDHQYYNEWEKLEHQIWSPISEALLVFMTNFMLIICSNFNMNCLLQLQIYKFWTLFEGKKQFYDNIHVMILLLTLLKCKSGKMFLYSVDSKDDWQPK